MGALPIAHLPLQANVPPPHTADECIRRRRKTAMWPFAKWLWAHYYCVAAKAVALLNNKTIAKVVKKVLSRWLTGVNIK